MRGVSSTPDSRPPLAGRVVVVTGVSRRAGIGHAIACRAADLGASLVCHHYSPHDAEQPWGADCVEATLASVRGHLTPGLCCLPDHYTAKDGNVKWVSLLRRTPNRALLHGGPPLEPRPCLGEGRLGIIRLK